MCLIIVLPKGTDKYADIVLKGIKNSSVTNKDGIGYGYKKSNSNKVYYDKGYTSADSFISQYESKKLKEKDEVIIHLRNGNVGNKDMINCHPFPLSNDEKVLESIIGSTDLGIMAHNGTFYKYNSYHNANKKSDTYQWIENFMYIPEVIALLKRDKELFAKIHQDYVGYSNTNKMAYLFADVGIITYGSFLKEGDYLFSNLSYKDKKYEDRGGEQVMNRMREYEGYNNKSGNHQYCKKRNVLGFHYPGVLDFPDDESDVDVNSVKSEETFDLRTFGERVVDEIEYITRQKRASTVTKSPDSSTLQHIDIELTRENCKELALVSKKTRDKNVVKEGVYLAEHDYHPDNQYNFLCRATNQTYFWMWTTDRINDPNEFIKIARQPYKEKYRDYMKLVNNIHPSKTFIKKLFKKISTANYRDHKEILIAGLGKLRIDSARLFYKRYEFMMDKEKYKEYKNRLKKELTEEYEHSDSIVD